MPTDSRQTYTNHPEKDLFLKIIEEQVALLPHELREFYKLRFKSHEEIMPWLLREKRSKELHCNREMRREMAFFISKTRFELEKAGYSFTNRLDKTPSKRLTKTLFPKLKSLWHTLTTIRSNDEDFDDIFKSVEQIESSLKKRQKANEEFDNWLNERRIKNEEWEEERRRREEETEKLMEEYRLFLEEIKQQVENRKKQQEEWQREWEEWERKHTEEGERRQKELKEERERELEEVRKRKRERKKEWQKREEEEEEKRRRKEHEKFLEDLEKWKENKRHQVEKDHKAKEEGQTYLSYTWPWWTWNPEFEEYLRRQYHDLICLFPHNVRKTLITVIPTLDDLRRKTNMATTFSDALSHKCQLDLFIEIFGFINNEYPYQIPEIEYLYEQMTGNWPHHDLTIDEIVTLRLLENTAKSKDREHLLRHQHPCHPTPSGYSYSSCCEIGFIDPNNAVFCEQREEHHPPRIDELFNQETAYPDFIILAVTLVQAARKVANKLYALKNRHGYYDKFSVISLSATRIRLYAAYNNYSFTDELFLIRDGKELYISYDKDGTEKNRLKINSNYFDELLAFEREFRLWLDRLKTVLLRLSDDRLIIYSDFYKIRIFDKSNQQSCSIYSLTSWIERHDINELATYKVRENSSDYHARNFPGKYHY